MGIPGEHGLGGRAADSTKERVLCPLGLHSRCHGRADTGLVGDRVFILSQGQMTGIPAPRPLRMAIKLQLLKTSYQLFLTLAPGKPNIRVLDTQFTAC